MNGHLKVFYGMKWRRLAFPKDLKTLNESMALGSGETTLEKLVLGYSAFVNGGHAIEPKMIDYIERMNSTNTYCQTQTFQQRNGGYI